MTAQSLRRLKLGLRLIVVSILALPVARIAVAFLYPGRVVAEAVWPGVVQMILLVLMIGQVLALAASAGRGFLALGLLVDLGLWFVSPEQEGIVPLLWLSASLLFLGFLYRLSSALDYLPLRQSVIKTLKYAGWAIVSCVTGCALGWALTALAGPSQDLQSAPAVTALATGGFVGICFLGASGVRYVYSIVLALSGCRALAARARDSEHTPVSAA